MGSPAAVMAATFVTRRGVGRCRGGARRLRPIDILSNNAGLNLRGQIDQLTLDEFRQVQETTVTGTWLMCRAVAPHLLAQKRGRVINMCSMLSVVALPERTPCATSKGAVLQLTRSLALDWAPHGTTVNAILPGPFGTEMNRALLNDPTAYQAFVAQIPLGPGANRARSAGWCSFSPATRPALSPAPASRSTGAGPRARRLPDADPRSKTHPCASAERP